MSFASQSKRETFIYQQEKFKSQVLGPGHYDIEGKAHKELMTAIYPKRKVAFNV